MDPTDAARRGRLTERHRRLLGAVVDFHESTSDGGCYFVWTVDFVNRLRRRDGHSYDCTESDLCELKRAHLIRLSNPLQGDAFRTAVNSLRLDLPYMTRNGKIREVRPTEEGTAIETTLRDAVSYILDRGGGAALIRDAWRDIVVPKDLGVWQPTYAEFAARVKERLNLKPAEGVEPVRLATEPEASLGAKPATAEGRGANRRNFVLPILGTKGWSILDWATNSGVDFHTANDYLKGATNPYASTRKKLADALGIAVGKLPE